MPRRKTIKECEDEHKLYYVGKDKDEAHKLLYLAKHRLEFWNDASFLCEKYPTIIIEGYYDIIKELLFAILAHDGIKSMNHECAIKYLSDKHKTVNIDFEFLFELKDLRNSINYSGTTISTEILTKNKYLLTQTIKDLLKYTSLLLNDKQKFKKQKNKIIKQKFKKEKEKSTSTS